MKKLIQALLTFGVELTESKSGNGFVVYNCSAIHTNEQELKALANECGWNIKHYPETKSFDAKTGEPVVRSERFFIGPMLTSNALSEDAALAAAMKMQGE